MTDDGKIRDKFKWHHDGHANSNTLRGLEALVRLLARRAAKKDFESAISESTLAESRSKLRKDPP